MKYGRKHAKDEDTYAVFDASGRFKEVLNYRPKILQNMCAHNVHEYLKDNRGVQESEMERFMDKQINYTTHRS